MNTSPKAVKILLGLGVGLLLLSGGLVRGLRLGPGRRHELARVWYHRFKSALTQNADAAQIPRERADAPLVLYDDGLGTGWQDWSWAAHDLRATAPVHAGGASITWSPKNYQGIYLHHDALGTMGYGSLQFFVHGPARLAVCAVDAGGHFGPAVLMERYQHPAKPSGWAAVRIPLAALGAARTGDAITGVVFQATGAAAQSLLALDDISLQPDDTLPRAPTRATVAVRIDVARDRHPISPLIYGMAFAPADYLSDLRLGLNRWGGNDKSRYNWVLGNADNAGRDWRFGNRTAYGDAPNGVPSAAADAFVRQNRAGGAGTLLTVPTLGWVARDADNATTSLGVPGGGGEPRTASGAISGYDPAANRRQTSVRSLPRKGRPFDDRPTLVDGVVYQDEWVHHLVETFGGAGAGGVRFYAMDNEPDLWDSTHTDVHPARMGYDDLLGNFLEYAAAVKDADPTAQVTGPVVSGWTGYEYSPLDRGDDNYRTHADQDRHDGVWFLPWFLRQVRAHDARSGRRSLDVLDVHYYPQAAGVYGGSLDGDARARRLRATRSLWDPDYTDESWIGQPVRLIPRMKDWVRQNYPGTKIGITEWNFGADGDISGALAIADALGLYGREGVDLADYWAYPPKGSPGYLAFKLYRNADGAGHGFGDEGCRAESADQGRVSVYAATESASGALTLLLVNKMPRATVTVPLSIPGLSPKAAVKRYRLAADNARQIARLPASLTGTTPTETLPPYSVTLLRISAKGGQPR